MDEENAVLAASRGDPLAIDDLLERHLPGLQAFIRLRMGPNLRARESSADLAQSVCREILEHIDRFRYPGEHAFRQWLYTEALRKIANRADYHMAARRDVRRDARPPARDSATDAGTLSRIHGTLFTPSREVMAAEEAERVERAFDQLPEDYREVILLTRVLGLSRAAAAREMNRTENAVRSLLHRALARLAEALETAAKAGRMPRPDE